MSLKSLAKAVLERNLRGNSQETTWQNQGNFKGLNQAKKFPVEINYVACADCKNFENGYCSVWNHYPDVPEYECRLCKQYIPKPIFDTHTGG